MEKKIVKKNSKKEFFGLSEKQQIEIINKAADRANKEQLTLVRQYERMVKGCETTNCN